MKTEKMYSLFLYHPSGGIQGYCHSDDLPSLIDLGIRESGHWRGHPVYLYKNGVDAFSHIDGVTTWAFSNGENVTYLGRVA